MASLPEQTDLLWPDSADGPWHIRIWWRAQHGVPTPVGLSIISWTDHDDVQFGRDEMLTLPREDADVSFPKVDGQLLRALPLGALVDASRAKLIEKLESRYEYGDEAGWPSWLRESTAIGRAKAAEEIAVLKSARKGRDLGDDHYRLVAQIYSEAARAGRPPTVAVKEHFHIEKTSAAKKVARARERGFLPPTSRGRVGPLTKEI